MSATPPPIPRDKAVLAQTWLDAELASALDLAVQDARTNRADYLRRLVIEAVRAVGYLPEAPTPRRHRARRRPEAVQ